LLRRHREMGKPMDYLLDEKGASARQLVLMFLAAVAVCAVFFSLGFVVGYNHAPSRLAPTTENVSASGNIPPTVNPPAGGSSESSTQGMQTENISPGSASVPQPERPAPLPPKPVAAAKSQAPKTPAKAAPRNVTRNTPAAAPQKRPSATASTSSDLHFAVQVMASRTRVDAENLVKLLKSHGYPAHVRTPQEAHAKDKLFRVQVGPFSSRVTADATRDKLVGEGFRPFVVHF
jgi:DedD protein